MEAAAIQLLAGDEPAPELARDVKVAEMSLAPVYYEDDLSDYDRGRDDEAIPAKPGLRALVRQHKLRHTIELLIRSTICSAMFERQRRQKRLEQMRDNSSWSH